MNFIGIDPGRTGGIAVLNDEGEIQFAEPLGDVSWFFMTMRELLKKKPVMVFCEKSQVMGARPQGVVSMFNYGVGFGELVGVLTAMRAPYELVPPQVWGKVIHAGATSGDLPKDKSRSVIKRLFPGVELKKPNSVRSVKMHDGMMDAVLIAEYGRRKMFTSRISKSPV